VSILEKVTIINIPSMVEYPDGMLTFRELAEVVGGDAAVEEALMAIADERGKTVRFSSSAEEAVYSVAVKYPSRHLACNTSQLLVNCGRASTSTISSSKIIASSNDWSSLGWVSFRQRPQGELCKDMKHGCPR
jgi:hypothetical protein